MGGSEFGQPSWTWLLIAGAVLYALHLFALWMESRGWIYWTKSGGHSTRAGNLLLELQQILEPSKWNVIDLKRNKKAVRDDQGDLPPEPE